MFRRHTGDGLVVFYGGPVYLRITSDSDCTDGGRHTDAQKELGVMIWKIRSGTNNASAAPCAATFPIHSSAVSPDARVECVCAQLFPFA